MFKMIKWLFFIAIVAGIAMWVTGYKLRGKTIEEHLSPILDSKFTKEGIKDMKALLGEGLKAAGQAISEDVTDAEKKQLDDILKKELQMGKPIGGVENQQALPPIPVSGAKTITAKPDLAKQVDQLKALQTEKK